MAKRRAAATQEGSIAVMGAIIVPVILAVIALAMSSLIWGASESEVQRAADQAAVEAAGSALLTDFPYASVTPLQALYPTLAQFGLDPANSVTPACQALGNPVSAATSVLTPVSQIIYTTIPNPIPGLPPIQIPSTVSGTLSAATQSALNAAVAALPADLKNALATLPTGCAALTGTTNPIPVEPDTSRKDGCDTAAENVTDDRAPYAVRFFQGSGGSTPTCLRIGGNGTAITGNGRVVVSEATKSPLLGIDPASVSLNSGTTVNGTPVGTSLTVPSGVATVQQQLAALGVRLDTVLPNALCPQVTVGVDQPVKGLIGGTSTPNGRATARRVMKNAVVVPVFNGRNLATATADVALSTGANAGLASVYTAVNGTVSTTVTTPALDLNAQLLDRARTQLLGALDAVDNRINATLASANATVGALAGTDLPVDISGSTTINGTTVTNTTPTASASLNQLDLLKCVRQTVSELYDSPKTGPDIDSITGIDNNHPVRDILADAAKAREPITIIQVGVRPCRTLPALVASAVNALQCMEAALGEGAATALNTVTGLYDIPFLDMTPAVVRDVGNGNYEAIPVHASQANGAFRAVLLRSDTDPRYVP